MIHAEALTEISRPVDEVFDFVSDCQNEPKWHVDVLESARTSEGQLGRGTSFQWTLTFFDGSRLEAAATVTGYEHNRLFEIQATAVNFRQAITYLFGAGDGFTHLTRRIWCATALSPAEERTLKASIEQKNSAVLDKLKKLLEARPERLSVNTDKEFSAVEA